MWFLDEITIQSLWHLWRNFRFEHSQFIRTVFNIEAHDFHSKLHHELQYLFFVLFSKHT